MAVACARIDPSHPAPSGSDVGCQSPHGECSPHGMLGRSRQRWQPHLRQLSPSCELPGQRH